MSDAYREFVARKAPAARPAGLAEVPALNPALFPFQRAAVEFLLSVGRGAAFLDTGLGKTLIQLEWARICAEAAGKPALILTPLAVAAQTLREARRFGVEARIIRQQAEAGSGVNICNYERLHLLTPDAYGAVALDESSILKSFTGATTRALIDAFADAPFRLACTATPAPNDHMELGQHSAFLGVMASSEMLTRWFVTDQEMMGRYRLKGHAVRPFWDWVASWARCAAKPSDLGFSDAGFVLPELKLHRHEVRADVSTDTGEHLFRIPDTSATAIHREKRLTADARAGVIAELTAAEPGEPWVVWCDTDYEADALTALMPEAVEVRGTMTAAEKERRLMAFSDGDVRILVTKPSIAGFGLNWQHCARMAFVGLSFSYESFYQAVRRCWRFGQKRDVQAHVACADTERAIWDVVSRKAGDHDSMKAEMAAAMMRAARAAQVRAPYEPTVEAALPSWLSGAAA